MTYEEAYEILYKGEPVDITDKNEEARLVALTAINAKISEPYWVPGDLDEYNRTDTFSCSSCGNYVYMLNKTHLCDYDFCPHCGKKMRRQHEVLFYA